VTKGRIWHVLDVRPLDPELAPEPVVGPDARFPGKVDPGDHLSDSAELPTVVDAEEEDGGSVVMMVLEGVVELLVSVIGRAPDAVLDGGSDV